MHRFSLDTDTGACKAWATCEARCLAGHVLLARYRLTPGADLLLETGMAVIAVQGGDAGMLQWQRPGTATKQSVMVAPGMSHYLDPGTVMPVRWATEQRLLVLAIRRGLLDRVLRDAFPCRTAVIGPIVAAPNPAIARMAPLWDRELESGGPGSRLYLESLACAALVAVHRAHDPQLRVQTALAGGLPPRRLRRVVDYIDCHLAEDVSLADLALVAGLSVHHFGAAFRASTGLPPHRFVIRRRLQRAEDLLRGSALPVADIAYAVGFSSQSHLTQHFRRCCGITPARLRRLAL